MFEFESFRSKGLTEGQDGATSEGVGVDVLTHLFAHLKVGLNLSGFRERNLFVVVFHLTISHDFAATGDFKVALVGVHHHGKIFVGAIGFGNDTAKTLFEHCQESGAIDVFGLVEFSKAVEETHLRGLLFGHIL